MRIVRALALLVWLSCLWLPAGAQRITFQRGDTRYTADKTGKNPRRLFGVSVGAGALWAAAPDGRRIATLMRQGTGPGAGTEVSGLGVRAAIVFLSDFDGRRRKRLFTTDILYDRQGRLVTETALGGASSVLMAEWEPVSLSWSADSRTIYVSCERIHEPRMKATFAVDALSGTAVIDADGRWKSLAPMTDVEGRGGLLIGSGLATFAPAGGGETVYEPLTAVNLFDQKRGALFTAPTGAELPLYASAHAPALGPGNRIIAFGNDNGLWTTDKFGKMYRRLLEGKVRRPRFEPGVSEATGLFCLLQRPGAEDKTIYDLYRADFPEGPDAPNPPPILIVQNVDWFDIIPD